MWVAGDGSDGFDRGLNRRGWVAVFDRGLLCHAWLARSGFCVLVGVSHGVGFFFYFLFYVGFCSGGILVGSGQWWRRGGGDWAVEERCRG